MTIASYLLLAQGLFDRKTVSMGQDVRIGIAFSGGGARGIAHLGVLKALLEADIRPAILSGTSAGAIVGVLHGAGMTPEEMLDFVRKTSFLRLLRAQLPYNGLIPLTYLRERILEVVPGDRFEDLQIPLYIAASNLNTGKCDYFSAGPLSAPVMASSSIPLLFKPVRIGESLYVDGGVVNNLPVDVIRSQADLVLAVNVMPEVVLRPKELGNVFQVGTRTFELSVIASSRPGMRMADLVIEPREVRNYSLFALNKYQEIFRLGYEAATSRLEAIVNMVEEKERLLNP